MLIHLSTERLALHSIRVAAYAKTATNTAENDRGHNEQCNGLDVALSAQLVPQVVGEAALTSADPESHAGDTDLLLHAIGAESYLAWITREGLVVIDRVLGADGDNAQLV